MNSSPILWSLLRAKKHRVFEDAGVGRRDHQAGSLIGPDPVSDFQQRRPKESHICHVTDDSTKLHVVADLIRSDEMMGAQSAIPTMTGSSAMANPAPVAPRTNSSP